MWVRKNNGNSEAIDFDGSLAPKDPKRGRSGEEIKEKDQKIEK